MKLKLLLLSVIGTLSAHAATEVEPNDTSATANAIVPGQPTTGQISSASDQDWFGFSMSGAGVVSVTFDSPLSSTFDYYTIQIRDSAGTVLASVGTGEDTTFQTGLSSSGAFYVVVLDGPHTTLSTAQYSVTISTGSAQPTVESEPNNASNEADPISNSLQTFGQLVSGSDQDWFSFATSGSGTVTVSFDSPLSSTFGYHTIQVQNGAGTIFASVDTGSDTAFQVGVPAAGTYFAVVRDGPHTTLSTKQYGLTVSSTAPQPPATVTASIHSAVEVVWNSNAGNTYIVEWTASLSTPNWLPLSPTLVGTGAQMSFLNSIRGQAQGFYRVKQN